MKDVKVAVNAAADYFDNVENVSRSQVVVFDIDYFVQPPGKALMPYATVDIFNANSGWAHMVLLVTWHIKICVHMHSNCRFACSCMMAPGFNSMPHAQNILLHVHRNSVSSAPDVE